jgi:hypothetical protein
MKLLRLGQFAGEVATQPGRLIGIEVANAGLQALDFL